MTANRFVVLSNDEEEWVLPTFAASSGAVRRVHQGRSHRDVHSRGVPDDG